jgi:hypothetical protein
LDIETKKNSHIFPGINSNKVLNNLYTELSRQNTYTKHITQSKHELFLTLNDINKHIMIKYCKTIINKNQKNSDDVFIINKKIKLFQTAFTEMAALFMNEPRKQNGKV